MKRPLRILALTAPVMVLAACRAEKPAPEVIAAVPVSVASVALDTVSQSITATGTFGARDQVPLSFKIGGMIARVMVDEGATVRKGQVLASLDLREIDAAVAKAKVAVDKTTRDAQRLERLHHDSVATLAQMQDAASAAEAARADLVSAQVNREYAMIIAPSDGIVQKRLQTAGTTTSPGVAVLQLGASDRGRVFRLGLSDREALRVHIGDRATVEFDAVPGKKFGGRVRLLGKSADARTGTYAIEVALENATTLPDGLVGRVALSPKSGALAMLVPIDALIEADADSAIIYTVGDGAQPKAEQHAVRILFLNGDQVAITGLDATANTRVITRGAAYLDQGTRVTVSMASDGIATPAKRTAAMTNGGAP